jgi:hypothetical protein
MCIKKNMPQNRGDVRPLRPILNRKKIEELLGEKFENVVMYYLDTNKLNRKVYNASPVVGYKQIQETISQITQDCANSSELSNRELLAVFAKTVDCNYSDWFINRVFFRVPPYDMNSKCIAGNVILFNNKTRKYETVPRGWFYAGGKNCRGSASEESVLSVMKTLKEYHAELLDRQFVKQRMAQEK